MCLMELSTQSNQIIANWDEYYVYAENLLECSVFLIAWSSVEKGGGGDDGEEISLVQIASLSNQPSHSRPPLPGPENQCFSYLSFVLIFVWFAALNRIYHAQTMSLTCIVLKWRRLWFNLSKNPTKMKKEMKTTRSKQPSLKYIEQVEIFGSK